MANIIHAREAWSDWDAYSTQSTKRESHRHLLSRTNAMLKPIRVHLSRATKNTPGLRQGCPTKRDWQPRSALHLIGQRPPRSISKGGLSWQISPLLQFIVHFLSTLYVQILVRDLPGAFISEPEIHLLHDKSLSSTPTKYTVSPPSSQLEDSTLESPEISHG